MSTQAPVQLKNTFVAGINKFGTIHVVRFDGQGGAVLQPVDDDAMLDIISNSFGGVIAVLGNGMVKVGAGVFQTKGLSVNIRLAEGADPEKAASLNLFGERGDTAIDAVKNFSNIASTLLD